MNVRQVAENRNLLEDDKTVEIASINKNAFNKIFQAKSSIGTSQILAQANSKMSEIALKKALDLSK